MADIESILSIGIDTKDAEKQLRALAKLLESVINQKRRIGIEYDTDVKALDEIKKKLSEVTVDKQVNVSANTKQANKDLSNTQKSIDTLKDAVIEVEVKSNDAENELSYINKLVDKTTTERNINFDYEIDNSSIEKFEKSVKNISDNTKLSIVANSQSAINSINELNEKAKTIIDKSFNISSNNKDAINDIIEVGNELKSINDAEIVVEISNDVIKDVQSLDEEIQALNDVRILFTSDNSDVLNDIAKIEDETEKIRLKELGIVVNKDGFIQLDKLQKQINSLESERIEIIAESSGSIEGIEVLQQKIDFLKDKKIKIISDTDESGITEYEKLLNSIDGKTIEINTNADFGDIEDLTDKIESIDDKTIEINTETKNIDKLKSKIDNLEDKEVKISSDTDESSITEYVKRLDSIDDKNIEIGANVEFYSIEQVIKNLEELNDKTIKINAETKNIDKLKSKIDNLDDKDIKVNAKVNDSEIDSLNKKINTNDDKTFVVKGDADFSDIFYRVDDLTEDIESKFEGLGDTLKLAVGGALIGFGVNLFSDLINGIGEAEQSMANLQAQTGATDEEVKRFAESAKNAFQQGVGESVNEAIKSIATANQLLGDFLEPTEIDSFVVKAGGIAKVFDKDINEVISRSRTSIINFNVDGETALNNVGLALQKAGNSADDVLDTFNEFAPRVAEAGLSIEEFTGVLIAGVNAGARDTDKLADAISEANTFIAEGSSIDAFDGLIESANGAEKQLAISIQNILKSAKAGNINTLEALRLSQEQLNQAIDGGEVTEAFNKAINIAIAGTPAEELGIEVFRKTFSAPLPVDVIKEQGIEASNLFQEAIEPKGFEGFTRQIEAIFFEVSQAIIPIVDNITKSLQSLTPTIKVIITTLSATLIPVIAFLVDNLDVIAPILGGILTALGTYITVTKAAAAAQVLLNIALNANPIGLIVTAIGALVGGLILAYNKSETFRKGVDGLFGILKDTWAFLQKSFINVINYLSNDLGDLAQKVIFLSTPLTAILEIFTWIKQPVLDLTEKYFPALKDEVLAIFDFVGGIQEKVSSFINGIFGMSGEIDKVSNKTNKAINNTASSYNNLKDKTEEINNAIDKNKDKSNELSESLDKTKNSMVGLSSSTVDANGNLNNFNSNFEKSVETLFEFEKRTKAISPELEKLTKQLTQFALDGIDDNTEEYQKVIDKAVVLLKEQNKINDAIEKTKAKLQELSNVSDNVVTLTIITETENAVNVADDFFNAYTYDKFITAEINIVGLEETEQKLFDFKDFSDILLTEITDNLVSIVSNVGAALGETLVNSESTLKDFGKVILKSILDTVQTAVNLYSAQQLAGLLAQPDSLATFGTVAFAKWAVFTASVNAVLSAARASIGAEGGVIGISESYNKKAGRTDTIPLLVAKGESIINAKATKENKGILEYINKGGNINNLLVPQQTFSDRNIVAELKNLSERVYNVEKSNYATANSVRRNTTITANFGKAKLRGNDFEVGINKIKSKYIRLN